MTRPLLVLLILVFLTTGCATALHGTRKKIRIETDPPGATATIGDQTIMTPGAIKIKRDKWDHFLIISKPGYQGEVFLLEQKESPLVGLNAFLLYGASTAIRTDMYTGGAWTIKPGKFIVKLTKIGEEGALEDQEIEHDTVSDGLEGPSKLAETETVDIGEPQGEIADNQTDVK